MIACPEAGTEETQATRTIGRAYSGCRIDTDERVRVLTPTGRPLDPCFNEVNHSPDGFEWGYGGSGPSQLAYAILRDFTGSRDITRKLYQQFKADKVANWEHDSWELPIFDLNRWLGEKL